ncbi:alpha/beta fold hydrolase [Undibacterium terreum]|uniref:Alpha/beta hydrolase n=1 Tax=Undibacterium terreum TaxID=1224302 RepID=A0A916XFA4_9BURK|nr:alpha/beta hydrolase [Undibacterium terreum]GGC69348.1 alpha/beta hydrolase [Undibacterium terreum]
MKQASSLLKKSLLALAAVSAFGSAIAAPADNADKTVVLVHGAFADGSSWDKIVPLLQAKGLKVVSVQNPLTSLADDVAATKRAIDAQTGKVILVGHSWGGTVITQAGADAKVSALVYVAAFAPSEGEAVGALGKEFPTPPGIAKLKADASGFLSLPAQAVAEDFAQDLPAAQTNLMAVSQGPINSKAFGEAVTVAAWKTKPSFYIVSAQDRMIAPGLEAAMAKKINATTTTLNTSHVPMLSKPADVAAVIIAAAAK